MDLDEAYRECERITWTQARNFAYGIRLLPAHKRRGLAVIYAFARRIDDIGDGTLPPEDKIAALEDARLALGDLIAVGADDPVLLALADVERNFPVPIAAFGELIDGCIADVRGTSYQTFEDLLHYCRCVAGSIGRLSLGIYGTSRDPEQAAELADSLGVALQLTNILRDIREDYQNGRVYLPSEDLAKFSVDLVSLGGDEPKSPPQTPPDHGGEPSPPDPRGPWQVWCLRRGRRGLRLDQGRRPGRAAVPGGPGHGLGRRCGLLGARPGRRFSRRPHHF